MQANVDIAQTPKNAVASVREMHLFLIRHAEAAEKKPGSKTDLVIGNRSIIRGRSNNSLVVTPRGERQTEILGSLLAAWKIKFDAIFASPAIRTIQTAYGLCDIMHFDRRKVVIKNALQEMSQGDWEGLSKDRVHWDERMREMDKDPMRSRAPRGESQEDVAQRMHNLAGNVLIMGDMRSLPERSLNVGFVGHAHAIKCFLRESVINWDPKRTQRISIDNCSLTELRWVFTERQKGWHLISLNEHRYLEGVGYQPNQLLT